MIGKHSRWGAHYLLWVLKSDLLATWIRRSSPSLLCIRTAAIPTSLASVARKKEAFASAWIRKLLACRMYRSSTKDCSCSCSHGMDSSLFSIQKHLVSLRNPESTCDSIQPFPGKTGRNPCALILGFLESSWEHGPWDECLLQWRLCQGLWSFLGTTCSSRYGVRDELLDRDRRAWIRDSSCLKKYWIPDSSCRSKLSFKQSWLTLSRNE